MEARPPGLAGGLAVSSPTPGPDGRLGGGEHMAAAWDNPPLSPLLHQRDGQGGCVGWGPRQRQKGQDGVSGCHCLGPGLGPEPTGSRRRGALCRGAEGEQQAREGPLPPMMLRALAPLLCFASRSVITEITEACSRPPSLLYSLFFLSETLRFKKKINIGFGCMPTGNIMVYSLLFRKKR